MQLFGFNISRADQEEKEDLKTFVPPQQEDGAIEIAPGGSYGTFVDLDGSAKSEAELVTRYREMAMQPECDSAIEDIVNEAIVIDEDHPIEIVLDDLNQPASIKNKVREEFGALLEMLDFSNKGYDIFKRWYVDGRIYHHIIIDDKAPRDGIKELRYIDPRKIRKVREKVKSKDPRTGATVYNKEQKEYYLYNPKGITSSSQQGIKIAIDSISHVHSGLMDSKNKMILGHMNKAVKPLNQLRMLEDATVIYRLARAPERRIFYIDVGNLPKMKAEQYLRDMMVKHKNKLVYDAQTGEVRDDRKFMTMLEDFWLPRRDGGRGTEITTLPGGQNLGEMDDVDYFRKKLYKSLNVPITRMESDNQFNLGRASEITRDEVKFNKFIIRLRNKFTYLFSGLLEIQLVLKGVLSRSDWEQMRNNIRYTFNEDNYFAELKDAEIMTERLRLAGEVDPLVGKYYSVKWVKEHILRMTEDDISQIDKEMDAERKEMDDEGGLGGPVDYQNAQPAQQQQPDQQETFVPQPTISDEEKRLVESMTRFMDSMASENIEDDDE